MVLTEEIKKAVREKICDTCYVERPNLTDDSRFFEDLGMDDLDIIEIAIDLEEELSVHIPDHEMARWTVVSDVFKTIEKI